MGFPQIIQVVQGRRPYNIFTYNIYLYLQYIFIYIYTIYISSALDTPDCPPGALPLISTASPTPCLAIIIALLSLCYLLPSLPSLYYHYAIFYHHCLPFTIIMLFTFPLQSLWYLLSSLLSIYYLYYIYCHHYFPFTIFMIFNFIITFHLQSLLYLLSSLLSIYYLYDIYFHHYFPFIIIICYLLSSCIAFILLSLCQLL